MADVVVTVPLRFGWSKWIDEGDPAGEPWSGTWYWFRYTKLQGIRGCLGDKSCSLM